MTAKVYRVDCNDCGYHPPFCRCEPPVRRELSDLSEERRFMEDNDFRFTGAFR